MKRFIAFLLLLLFCLGGCSAQLPYSPAQSSSIEVLFSPDGGIQSRIIDEIDKTKESIDIAIFDFTSDKIAQALVRAKERGVSIRLIMDKKQAGGQYSRYKDFEEKNFEVKLKSGRGGGIMHHKIIIFDNRLVMTGSYNLSDNAELHNYENAVFISDRDVVDKYRGMFDELWNKPNNNKKK